MSFLQLVLGWAEIVHVRGQKHPFTSSKGQACFFVVRHHITSLVGFVFRTITMPYCIAFNCYNSIDKQCPAVSFHRFPVKNKPLWKHWEAALKLKDIPIQDQNARVCSEHFPESCYTPNLQQRLLGIASKRTLLPDAVPSIFNFPRQQHAKRRPLSEGRALTKRSREELDSSVDDTEQLLEQANEDTLQLDEYEGIACSVEVQTGKGQASFVIAPKVSLLHL